MSVVFAVTVTICLVMILLKVRDNLWIGGAFQLMGSGSAYLLKPSLVSQIQKRTLSWYGAFVGINFISLLLMFLGIGYLRNALGALMSVQSIIGLASMILPLLIVAVLSVELLSLILLRKELSNA
ncbi:MAG: hypothetical protein SFX74_11255 [Fimbriimonadaceae bacterium]|nr:hypothetical protein [Fimbriimonadaceae bacterium]